MTIAPPEEVFEFLKKAHDDFQPLSEKVIFDKEHPLHLTSIALYGSIIELTGSIIFLTKKQLLTGVPILLRSILEAYVDLVNLSKSCRYGYCLEVSYLKEWLKILDEAQLGRNEYLAGITALPNLNQTIGMWKKKKKELETKGYRALKIEQKFTQADMEKEYKSLYNMLCSDSHNNLRSLIERHTERKETDFSVVVYKAYTPEDSAIYVGTNAELLVRATQLIHDYFDSPVRSEIPKYRSELDRLRGD